MSGSDHGLNLRSGQLVLDLCSHTGPRSCFLMSGCFCGFQPPFLLFHLETIAGLTPIPSTWKSHFFFQIQLRCHLLLKTFLNALGRDHIFGFAPRPLTITAVSFVPLHCIVPACRTISYSSLCTWSLEKLLIHSIPPVYPRWVGKERKWTKNQWILAPP